MNVIQSFETVGTSYCDIDEESNHIAGEGDMLLLVYTSNIHRSINFCITCQVTNDLT
jgi:hypothetical protein